MAIAWRCFSSWKRLTREYENSEYAGHTRLYGLESIDRVALVLGTVSFLGFTSLAIVLVLVFSPYFIGVAMFKRRVSGVYFSIITQAFASILSILIIGQQGYTGGVNGITDLRTLLGWDIRTDLAKYQLYYLCVFSCWVAF